MKISLILCIFFIPSLHAMEPTNQLIPRIPLDVMRYSILPILSQEIVTQETISVKNARCELGALSLVNKQFNTFIKTTLENPDFTLFFIKTFKKKFLNGDAFAIAAHLGTLSSMTWVKKQFRLGRGPLISNSAILLDQVTDYNTYMLNAHKLLYHLSTVVFDYHVEITNINNPSVKKSLYTAKPTFLNRLQNNKITYKLLSLLLHDNLVTITSARFLNNQSFAVHCLLNNRTDLLPLAHDLKTINHVDNDNNNELMHAVQAAFKKDVELKNIFNFIDFSLRSKPDLELKNKDNKTVFDIAIKMGEDNPRIAKLIMRKLVHAKTINWVHDEAKQT